GTPRSAAGKAYAAIAVGRREPRAAPAAALFEAHYHNSGRIAGLRRASMSLITLRTFAALAAATCLITASAAAQGTQGQPAAPPATPAPAARDRKSTRLNSSHPAISYAVF